VAWAKRKSAKESGGAWLILIGVFKLLKAVTLLIVGIGLLHLLHRDIGAVTTHWIERFRLDPDNEHIHRMLSRVFRVTPKQLKELSAGTFIYAGIFLIEGTGLVMRKHWAEYFTLISTALFVPLEVYELIHRLTVIRVSVLAINLAILWYLAARIKRRRP
jgi:uncharacterized membrane protein (DUF2068 family)